MDDEWPAGSGAVAAAWTEMNDASGGLEQCLLRNPVSALFSNDQKGSSAQTKRRKDKGFRKKNEALLLY